MKKSQLKATLRPIVKECITEILLEQGLLSNIISEVVKGLQPIHTQPSVAAPSKQLVFQQQQLEEQRMQLETDRQQQLKEQKRKLLDATGLKTNVFEGVAPISQGAESSSPQTQAGSLAGVEPSDAGVDLSGIMKIANRDWSKMI